MLCTAQITLDETILPQANDVYSSFIDELPDIDPGRQGLDQFWDFSELSSGLVYESNLYPPDPLLIKSKVDYDFYRIENRKIYRLMKRVGDEIYEVAVQRPHPLNSDYITFARYENPKLIYFSPLSYRTEKTDRSSIYFDMPGQNIPQLIKDRLPVSADSIRLHVSTITDLRVDAAGTLLLGYERYDVLRQEVISSVDRQVEIYSAGKWSVVNNMILDPTEEFLGEKVEKHYRFLAEDEKFPIAKITVDEAGEVLEAEVKAPEQIDHLVRADSDEPLLVLSPNPTYGDVKLELMNLNRGTYSFEIANIIGKKLWEKNVEVDRNYNSYKFNFGFLGKGTYLWTITDERGIRLTTKRLVIVAP